MTFSIAIIWTFSVLVAFLIPAVILNKQILKLTNKIFLIETQLKTSLETISTLKEWNQEQAKEINNFPEELRLARQEAIKKSRSVLRGNEVQHLVPIMLPHFWPTKDWKFLGDPIDYIIFENVSFANSGNDTEINLILADIKTGNSSLNKTQKLIRDAVVSGRVVFATINPDKSTIRIYKPNNEYEDIPFNTEASQDTEEK